MSETSYRERETVVRYNMSQAFTLCRENQQVHESDEKTAVLKRLPLTTKMPEQPHVVLKDKTAGKNVQCIIANEVDRAQSVKIVSNGCNKHSLVFRMSAQMCSPFFDGDRKVDDST